ncbi:MAG: 50S ribosomal protein L34 [Clostridia bacterium]|nr:50S ribosomal protein L34 [Clostridia bacterium]
MKSTYQPKKKQRSKVHGFRARMKTLSGRKVIKRRRNKGKKELSR